MSDLSALTATLWQRIKAFAFDYIIISGYLIFVVVVGVGLNLYAPLITQTLFANRYGGHAISFLLVTLPVTLYYARAESSPQQATWGKRKVALRVTRTDGTPLTFARAFTRTLLKFIPWELSHTLIWQLRFAQPEAAPLINGGFALVWLLIIANIISLWLSKNHQTLYDKLTATTVVKIKSNPIQQS